MIGKLCFSAAALIAAALCATTAPAPAQTSVPPDAADFVLSAIQSDEYKIQAAEVALAGSKNPQLRAFAQQMIADHGL